MEMYTPHQAKYFAEQILLKRPQASIDGLASAMSGVKVDLNPHQVDAALFALKSPLSTGVLLADEVGLGKTIEAGLVLAQSWSERKRHILLIVPASLRTQWRTELEEKFYIKSTILESANYNKAKKAGAINPFDIKDEVVICSFNFASLKEFDVHAISWDLVIIDEAHRLRNVYKSGNMTGTRLRRALSGRRKLLLTATPLQNNLMELFGLVSIIDEHVFGDARTFKEMYVSVTNEEVRNSTLKARLAQFCNQDVDEAHVIALKKRLEEEPGEFGGLSTEETGRMKTLQIRQASLESMQSATDAQVLKIYEDQLADLLVQIDDAKGQFKDLRDEISRYGNVSDLTAVAKENAQNLAKCYSKIENLKEGIQATKDKIKEADIALASLEEKVRKAGTSDADLNLAVKKVEICAALHQLFNDGIAAYRDKLKAEVERDATELFCKISSDPDYTALKINDNYGLSIQHKSGEIIPFCSAGFEHIVALSLIGALHKNAPLSGPIIMDSPFGRLDPTHKKNITKALPLMSDQIILLAYTDEIDGQTAREVLGSTLKKEYRLRKYGSFHTAIELQ